MASCPLLIVAINLKQAKLKEPTCELALFATLGPEAFIYLFPMNVL